MIDYSRWDQTTAVMLVCGNCYPELVEQILRLMESDPFTARVRRKSIIKSNPFDKDRCGGLLHRTMKASRDLKMHNPTSGLARTGVVCF